MKRLCCRILLFPLALLSTIAGPGGRRVAAATSPAPTVGITRLSTLMNEVWPADFNGDGITDLAGSSPSQVVRVLLGNGDGTFKPPIDAIVGYGLVKAAADFNNDGKIDLVVQYLPQPGSPTVILKGNGDGTFANAAPIVGDFDGISFTATADLNGDGKRDLVISPLQSGELQVFQGNGDLTFGTPVHLTAGLDVTGGIIADFNADGRPDIVAANQEGRSISIFRNTGGFVFTATDVPLDRRATDATAADVNGDGKLDLILSAGEGVETAGMGFMYTDGYAYVMTGRGDVTFNAPVRYPTAPGAFTVVVGDFTRDGIPDIATGNRSRIVYDDCGPSEKTWDTISILPGNGDGTYGAASSFSIGNQLNPTSPRYRNEMRSLNTSDLNGDRATDLIASGGVLFFNRPADPNWAPTVSLGPDYTSESGEFTLAAKADDVDQDMLTYQWTSSDGSLPPIPTQCFGSVQDGVHTYTVTVNDGHGHTATDSVTVTVNRGGGGATTTVKMITPIGGETLTAGAPYTIKWHVDDSAQAVYEWSIFYTLDNGATWNTMWECHTIGQPSGPGVPNSRDEQCTWNNPGPPSTQARIHVAAQDDADAEFAGATSGNFTIKAATGAVPDPWKHQDIGSVGAAGTATYDAGVFTVSASGADIWSTADEFQFVYQDLGTFSNNDSFTTEYTTRVDSVQNVNAWTKAGLMIRDGLGANARHASVFVSPGKGIAFQRRLSTGGTSTSISGPALTAPVWLKLGFHGDLVTAYYRKNLTDPWTAIGNQTLSGWSQLAVGLAVTSHADGTLATARFSNVSFVSNRDWTSADVGTTGGSTTSDGVVTSITAKGADIWGTSDQFRFAATDWSLIDGSITARVRSVENVNAWTKAGVMFRERATGGAQAANGKYVFVMVTPGKGVNMQYRGAVGGAAATAGTQIAGVVPGWVRLARRGDTYTGFWSADGVSWTTVGTITVAMDRFRLSAGLALTSHSTATATASFDDVVIKE